MSDVISRSELLKQFPVNMENPLWHFTGIRAAIEAAPVVDAVPVVHAYWKNTYDMIDGHDGYECSACGYTKYFDHYAEGIALCKPYCCNCGARMDGESE